MYLGYTIHVSPYLGPKPIPIRIYKERKWASKARVARVQKKWTKRFGTEIKDDILILQEKGMILTSKENFAVICAEMEKENRRVKRGY